MHINGVLTVEADRNINEATPNNDNRSQTLVTTVLLPLPYSQGRLVALSSWYTRKQL
jgi:hypothetical protein